jgi:hypothetical protein
MPSDRTPEQSMAERIEAALLALAYVIERDGDKYLPLYEQFERELQELRARENTRARARQRLLAYREAGALKAIR